MSALRLLLAILFLPLLIAVGFAADPPLPSDPNLDFVQRNGGIVYAVPKKGPLHFKQMEEQGARFAGQIRLTGTYVYGHTGADATEDMDADPELYFLPDDATRALLPYWYERGPVREIYFENSDAFLAAVLTPDVIARVKARKLHQATGKTAVLVDNYFATGECDHATYIVRFLKLDVQPQLVARNEFVEQLACG